MKTDPYDRQRPNDFNHVKFVHKFGGTSAKWLKITSNNQAASISSVYVVIIMSQTQSTAARRGAAPRRHNHTTINSLARPVRSGPVCVSLSSIDRHAMRRGKMSTLRGRLGLGPVNGVTSTVMIDVIKRRSVHVFMAGRSRRQWTTFIGGLR